MNMLVSQTRKGERLLLLLNNNDICKIMKKGMEIIGVFNKIKKNE
jgi:hypothetical protein